MVGEWGVGDGDRGVSVLLGLSAGGLAGVLMRKLAMLSLLRGAVAAVSQIGAARIHGGGWEIGVVGPGRESSSS